MFSAVEKFATREVVKWIIPGEFPPYLLFTWTSIYRDIEGRSVYRRGPRGNPCSRLARANKYRRRTSCEQFVKDGGSSPSRFSFASVVDRDGDLGFASAACFLMKESNGRRGTDTGKKNAPGSETGFRRAP